MRKRVLDSVKIAAWLLAFTAGLFAVAVMIAAICVPYVLWEIAGGVYAFVAGKPYETEGGDGWHFRM